MLVLSLVRLWVLAVAPPGTEVRFTCVGEPAVPVD